MKPKIDYAQILIKIYSVMLKFKYPDEETRSIEYILNFWIGEKHTIQLHSRIFREFWFSEKRSSLQIGRKHMIWGNWNYPYLNHY
jgi:hypothetical protein